LGTRRSERGWTALLPTPEDGSVSRLPAQRAGSSAVAEARFVQAWTTFGESVCLFVGIALTKWFLQG
jgi:hypothetical protein